MKKSILGFLLIASIGTIQLSSCKGKKNDTTTNTVDTIVTPATAPVVISTDTQLETSIKDAVKDYPGVTATVNNGEVTLTGTIKRDRLPNLMQSLQSLNPKKVNNNLTIQ